MKSDIENIHVILILLNVGAFMLNIYEMNSLVNDESDWKKWELLSNEYRNDWVISDIIVNY